PSPPYTLSLHDALPIFNRMQEYTENYIRAGGKRSFSEYYTAMYDGALFSPSLTRNVVFSQHNLVTDRSFAEFNIIFCRNVLIYRSEEHTSELQSRSDLV